MFENQDAYVFLDFHMGFDLPTITIKPSRNVNSKNQHVSRDLGEAIMKIVNIVAIAKVKGTFDLTFLAQKLSGSEYSPKNPWVKMRLKPEGYYIAFYRSGKFLVIGIQDLDQIRTIVARVLQKLEEIGIKTELESVTVQNIVLTDEVSLDMPLESIVQSMEDPHVSYEPEQFPALFYKDEEGLNYMLFSSGKLVITGATDIASAKRGLERFKILIKSYAK